MKKRAEIRIGMPRVLNMYSQTPIFTGYFASLGIKAENIVYSDYTSEELYKEGAKRGAIDPCFPSKLGIPHVHNLLYKVHAKKPLDIIFFPMIDCLTTRSAQGAGQPLLPHGGDHAGGGEGGVHQGRRPVRGKGRPVPGHLRQPLQARPARAADVRAVQGHPGPLAARRTSAPSRRAIARSSYFNNVTMRGAAREVLEQLEREDRLGVVLLGRPYHNDPGVNHEILEEFQKLGYPVFTQDCLPIDDDIIWRLFGDEVLAGEIPHPMSINDVWKNSYSENTTPQGVGREVRGAASEPGGARAFQLQVRPRRAHLHGGRRDRGALRHAVLLLQGHRREQAHRLHQDPRRDHRLLPEALPRRHGAQQEEGQDHRRAAAANSKRGCAARCCARSWTNDLVRESFETGSMPQIHVSIGALAASRPRGAKSTKPCKATKLRHLLSNTQRSIGAATVRGRPAAQDAPAPGVNPHAVADFGQAGACATIRYHPRSPRNLLTTNCLTVW